jgi:hypothetical protein
MGMCARKRGKAFGSGSASEDNALKLRSLLGRSGHRAMAGPDPRGPPLTPLPTSAAPNCCDANWPLKPHSAARISLL